MHHYLKQVVRSRAAVVSSMLIGSAMVLGGGAGQAYGQAANLDSTLTSTSTAQVLFLNTSVVPLSTGLYHWTFRLTNPLGNTSRVRFFTAAPNCDLSQISNIQSPPGWVMQVFRNQGEAPDAPKINWFVAPGQPGPLSPGTPWLAPVPGQNVKVFSFDLPIGANNRSGHAAALNTFGFSGATLGCQVGNLSITGTCSPQGQPNVFRVTYAVQFQNRGSVTITVTHSGQSQSQTLNNLSSGNYSADFNLGAVAGPNDIIQINGAAVESGVTFTASATAQGMDPVVIVPGILPTDPQDTAMASGSPLGLVQFLGSKFPKGGFVCPPMVIVGMFCPPNDPIDQAADMLNQLVNEAIAQSGASKVHLVAHGGGAILARYYLRHVDRTASRVRSLTLVSPPNLGTLCAMLTPNRDAFSRYCPAYPFWTDSIGSTQMYSVGNNLLQQDLGSAAPPVPTCVIYGTGIDTPAIAYGSPTDPYSVQNESGDGTVIERSARALTGADLVPIARLRFTNGLSDPGVGQAVLNHILAH